MVLKMNVQNTDDPTFSLKYLFSFERIIVFIKLFVDLIALVLHVKSSYVALLKYVGSDYISVLSSVLSFVVCLCI